MQVDVVTIKNRFPGMSGRFHQGVDDILFKGANDIWAASLPYTPIHFGFLRGNVRADKTGVYWMQFYAAYQNFGTVRGVTPKLFANHGYDVTVPGMLSAFTQLEGGMS